MEKVIPTPTKKAGIPVTWNCKIKCKFCFHAFNPDRSDFALTDIKNSILAAKSRGNNYVELVGPGEPTLHPDIIEIISFAKNNGLKISMITCAIFSDKKLEGMLAEGMDDFNISLHGLEKTHNELVQAPFARKVQEKVMNKLLSRSKTFRVDYVITAYNYKEIYEFSRYIVNWPVRIVNFLNFTPHNAWAGKEEIKTCAANLRDTESILNDSIHLLEEKNIGVNVRYYPMCRIGKENRKNICNDLQVMFDPYEWDYSILPKNFSTFRDYGMGVSNSIENKSGKCAECSLINICGGINKEFNAATGGTLIDAIKEDVEDYFYLYRQDNYRVFVVPY